MSQVQRLTQDDIDDMSYAVAMEIIGLPQVQHCKKTGTIVKLFGVPRGGIPAAYAVCTQLMGLDILCRVVDRPAEAMFIIDDLVDSGATRDRYLQAHPTSIFMALIDKTTAGASDNWYVFPWEESEFNGDTSAEDIPIRLLQYIGEDPKRGGLLETPKRMLKAWRHYTSGYNIEPSEVLKVFEDGAENYDEMVLVKNIPVYSHCEHHLAPFFGVAHVAYIPDGKIVGLSKLSRLVDIFSRRLQVQERLTNQVADALMENLMPKGAAVVLECRHMCMEARGIQRQGATTVTSSMKGVFMEEGKARAEFLQLVNLNK